MRFLGALDELREWQGYVALVALILGLLDSTLTVPVAAIGALLLVTVCHSLRLGAVIILLFAVGSQLSTWREDSQKRPDISALIGHRLTVRATLLEHLRQTPFGYSASVSLDSGLARGAKVQLAVRQDDGAGKAPIGSGITFSGKFTPLNKNQSYLSARGVKAQVAAQSFRLTGRGRGGWGGLVDQLRVGAEGAIGSGLGDSQAALARGMVLGQDAEISDLARDEFRTTGLTHLVAASGQNILLLVGILIPAFTLLGMRRWMRVVLLLLAIGLYVPLAGGGPSIQRAGVMGAIGCIGMLVGRSPLRWYSLLIGAAVTLLINPRAYEDVGWQLSFVAVVGIFLLSEPITQRVGRVLPRKVAEVVGVTLAATAATAPIMFLVFGQLSWVSVPTNLAVAPAVGPVMLLGAASVAVGTMDVRLAVLINGLTQFPLAYIQAVAHVGATLAVAPLPLIGGGAAPPTKPTVSFLSVGQGDATLFQAGGKTVLVDTGPPGGPIVSELRKAGVRSIDLLVVTHPEVDHEGEASGLIEQFPVGLLLDGGYGASGKEREEILAAAASHHVKRVLPEVGQTVEVGDISLKVFWPTRDSVTTSTNPNDRAIVAVARVKGLSVLLTADAESNVTGALDLPPVDVLKVAHHGSADDGLSELLERVSPKNAVIEVGANNSYGHPAPETLAALRVVPRVYRTDRDGTVRLVGD